MLCVLGKKAIWHGFAEWVHGFSCIGSGCRGICRSWQGCGRVAGCMEATRVGRRGCGTCQKAASESLVAENPAAVAVRRGVSGKGVGAEEMASKWSNSALAASRWPGVHERMGSKCGGVVERMAGEPKVAEQPLLHQGRWTLEQNASNVGH